MELRKHFLLLGLVLMMSNMFAQLIVNDEFTSKGVAPEGSFVFTEGDIIPNLRFKNLKSEYFNLHEKLDKLSIIEFWYVGCKTCVSNKKYLQKFSNQYNINVISISVDDKPSTVRKYLADNNIYWDNIQDNTAFKGFYQKTKGVALPTYIIINSDKEILKVFDSSASDVGRIGVFLQNYSN